MLWPMKRHRRRNDLMPQRLEGAGAGFQVSRQRFWIPRVLGRRDVHEGEVPPWVLSPKLLKSPMQSARGRPMTLRGVTVLIVEEHLQRSVDPSMSNSRRVKDAVKELEGEIQKSNVKSTTGEAGGQKERP